MGTTIKNQTSVGTLYCVATYGGVNSTKQSVTVYQAANLVTSVTPYGTASGDKHFSYANILPSATSASVLLSGAAKFKFSSGSEYSSSSSGTGVITNVTVSYSRTYSLASSTNGFTSVNSSGTLTATSYGTTIGSNRTSSNVTSVLTVTATHGSSYGGTSVIGTLSQTNTCTQTANYITTVTPTCGAIAYSQSIAANATSASLTSNGANSYKLTFASNSTLTSAPSTTYGTISESVSYKLSASQNGFTAINASTGVLTCTNCGATVSEARSSGTVTKTYTVT